MGDKLQRVKNYVYPCMLICKITNQFTYFQLEGLINFEKMRLVAKEIRNLTAMCSAPLRGISDTIIAMNDTEVSSTVMLCFPNFIGYVIRFPSFV